MKTNRPGAGSGGKSRSSDKQPFTGKSTGFIEENAACLNAAVGAGRGNDPAPAAWMTPALIKETHEMWSKRYGRALERCEVLEILRNVRWFGEILRRWLEGRVTT